MSLCILEFPEMNYKTCKHCNEEKEITLFVKHTSYKDGYMSRCKKCDNKIRNKKRNEKMKNLKIDKDSTKICMDCKQEKQITLFAKSKSCKDGYSNRCKECKNLKQRERYSKIEQDKSIEEKQCTVCNQIVKIENFTKNTSYKDGYEKRCVICQRKGVKKYREQPENIEKVKKWRKTWNSKPENKLKMKEYRKENTIKQKEYQKKHKQKESFKIKRNKHRRERYKNDVKYKITRLLRSRLIASVKNKSNDVSTLELLGCSIKDFKEYIESQFKEGMTWGNHGEWHIDHCRPCASFDLSKKTEQRICFNWRNMQPLWGEENLTKNAKYDIPDWKELIRIN